MPDIKINSNRELFEFHSSSQHSEKPEDQPLKIVVLADLSGRPVDNHKSSGLRRIDKDNFDTVFTRSKVTLTLPHHDQPLPFEDWEDLHPDYLYQQLPVFTAIRQLKRRLPQVNSVQDLSAELRALDLALDSHSTSSQADPPPQAIPPRAPEGLLDSLLEQQSQAHPEPPPFQDLIREIVAPYAEGKQDPQLDDVSMALDELANHRLRQILKAPPFRQCEASWRSLSWLNRVLDTDRQCHLYVLDVDAHSLSQTLENEQDLPQTQLYDQLVNQQTVSGAQSFDVILLDMPLPANEQSLRLLSAMGCLASAADAVLLADGRGLLGGSQWASQLENGQAPIQQGALADLWQRLRTQTYATRTYLSAPGHLVRLPYGAKTRPCEALAFEELSNPPQSDDYLWGNGAYLLCRLLAENRGMVKPQSGYPWRATVEGLPMHVYTLEDEPAITPPAEVYLTEREARKLNELGFTALRSVQHRDAVMVDAWCSAAVPNVTETEG